MNKNLSPLEMAYLGDAIHTLFVREWALKNFNLPMNELNKICSEKCSAVRQSQVLSGLSLTDEEADIARRARNVKSKHTAKNADVKDYKFATAFEAVVGHLKITGQDERLKEILEFSVK